MKRNLLYTAIILVFLGVGLTNRALSNFSEPDAQRNSTNYWAILPFTKIDNVNPILLPGKGSFTDPILNRKVLWEEKDVFNPAIVQRGNKIYMLYRAQDKTGKPQGTSRIGLAVSTDAMHFTRMPKPVLYPDNDACKMLEWEGGCEDPRVVEDDLGKYYMTYTAFDGKIARLLVATSTDLLHWTKHGSAFAKAYKGKYASQWSKSGSIVSTYKNGKIIATKIGGKYWMYWGDKQLLCATSDDLINWSPVEADKQAHIAALKIVLPTRKGMFDSDLVESGPPAMLTDKGILLIYNSRNDRAIGDKSLSDGTYSAAQVLFDKHDPTKVLQRMNTSFIKPGKPYELLGQVNQVCFVEGLTNFKNKWYLYYGTADSKIAVACSPVK
ncbi:MAG TPA: glycoside hydrolase family 130 protein [Mucilaginibacter sp.]|jgi:predicted GH43/DUF377 family glycosyl hydrolase